HVRRFNERVREILVGRIQRMVNFECAATFGDGPAYRQVPVHPSVALRPHTQALGAGRADGGGRGHSPHASPAALSRTLDTPAQAGGILIDENSAPRSCSCVQRTLGCTQYGYTAIGNADSGNAGRPLALNACTRRAIALEAPAETLSAGGAGEPG